MVNSPLTLRRPPRSADFDELSRVELTAEALSSPEKGGIERGESTFFTPLLEPSQQIQQLAIQFMAVPVFVSHIGPAGV